MYIIVRTREIIRTQLHGFPRWAGHSPPGSPEYLQASSFKLTIFSRSTRVNKTRSTKHGFQFPIHIFPRIYLSTQKFENSSVRPKVLVYINHIKNRVKPYRVNYCKTTPLLPQHTKPLHPQPKIEVIQLMSIMVMILKSIKLISNPGLYKCCMKSSAYAIIHHIFSDVSFTIHKLRNSTSCHFSHHLARPIIS